MHRRTWIEHLWLAALLSSLAWNHAEESVTFDVVGELGHISGNMTVPGYFCDGWKANYSEQLSFDYDFTFDGNTVSSNLLGCCGVHSGSSGPHLTNQMAGAGTYHALVALTVPGEICGVSFTLAGLPSCFDQASETVPASWTSGTRPSVVQWVTTVERNSNSVPVATWSVKNQAGALVEATPANGHYQLVADGMSAAIATVINTGEDPAFQFTGDPLGCALTETAAGAVLNAGTALGTVRVTAMITDTDPCLERDFYFDLLPPCSTCMDGPCPVGAVTASQGSVDVLIGLGPGRGGLSQAYLQVSSETPSPELGTPALLRCDFIQPDLQKITNASGGLRQLRVLDGFLDITTNSASSYSINFYNPTNLLGFARGLYSFTNGPDRSVTIELVGGNTNHVRITESQGPVITDYHWETNGWALETGSGLRRETKTVSVSGDTRTETTTIGRTGGEVERRFVEIWQTHSFGERLMAEVLGSGPTARTNTYSYHTNGLVEQVVRWDGSWDIYRYDELGRQIEHYSPFLNSPPTTNASLCRRVSSTYDTAAVSGSGDDASFGKYTPRRVIESVQGAELRRRYTVVKADERQEILCPNPGTAWNDSSNLVTTTHLRTDSWQFGKPAVIVNADGTVQLFSYTRGALPGTTSPSYEKILVSRGAANGALTAVVAGTREETWVDKAGRAIYRQTTDIESGLLTSRTIHTYDRDGRITFINHLDGTMESRAYDCCHLLSTTDRAGTVTRYTYDALGRRLTTTRDGIVTSNFWSSAGDRLAQYRIGTNGHRIRLAGLAYDTAGRLLSATNALGAVTRYTEQVDSAGRLVRITTHADDSTVVDTLARDGTLLRRDGTGVFGVRYTNGVMSLHGRDRFYQQEIRLLTNGLDSGEWVRTIEDGLGRTVETGFPGGATHVVAYNALGQLASAMDADGVTTLYAYDNLGRLEYTAVDADRDGELDLDGPDRVTRMVSDVTHSTPYGVAARRTRTYVYATDNDAGATLLLERAESLYDQRFWETADGLTHASVLDYLGDGTTRVTHTAPDGTQIVETFQSERPLSVTVSNAVEGVLRQASYGYDPHNRRSSVTDLRTGTTRFTFDDLDRVLTVTAPAPGDGQPAPVTTLAYDDAARVSRHQAPDGLWSTNAYNPDGTLRTTAGARIYPVEYTYDHAGRLETMKTWQDRAGNHGSAVTTWKYDERGFMTNKLNAAGEGPTYTFTPAGRPATRIWARGVSTTYTYGDAGDLTHIDYSDTTPDVSLGYDRQGRPTHIEGATTHDRAFTTHGLLVSDDVENAGWNYFSRTRLGYDTQRRRSVLTNLTLSLIHRYGYDAASRLGTVAATDGGLTMLAGYSYLENSTLVEGLTLQHGDTTRLTTRRTYDNLNRLMFIASTNSALPSPISFSYTNNNVNQRTRVTHADASYWLYGYDPLGQLTNGARHWNGGSHVLGQTFRYTFDHIGNRKTAETGGDDATSNLRLANYSPNLLNQYAQRTVPGYIEVSGTATNTATVTVNADSAERQGDYFRREVAVNNAGTAAVQWLNTMATNAHGTTTVTRLAYVPKTPESFAHDADGNLTRDGLWRYDWDGENRLTRIELQTNIITDSACWQRVDCDYDHLGRRIRKRVSGWNPHSENYLPNRSVRYFYDGWNVVAQTDEVTGQRMSFLWGTDLSGTLQDAGGAGGLLAMTVHTGPHAGTYFYGYDGNGNVAVLIDADGGCEAARYEYGPFGELIRATGPLATLNPFRFSTKYQDEETGLIHFGHRYYATATGRWLSADPIGESGGLNLYAFIGNHPVSGVDALGLALYAFDGTGNTLGQKTHVAALLSAYQGNKEYEEGVGTRFRGLFDNRAIGGLTGAGASTRLESMYRKFLVNYAAGDKEVDIIGFSRGAALAREFANMLNERGYQKTMKTSRGSKRVGKKCPVKIRFVGLFDTVGSFGIPGNHVNPGVNLNVPSNVSNAAHAIAEDEKRALFPYSPLNTPRAGQNFVERSFPGDHSDIGGGHGDDNNLLSEAPLRFMWGQGQSAGAPFGPLPKRAVQKKNTPHDMRGATFSFATHAIYNLSPAMIIMNGGFTSPTQTRNLPR